MLSSERSLKRQRTGWNCQIELGNGWSDGQEVVGEEGVEVFDLRCECSPSLRLPVRSLLFCFVSFRLIPVPFLSFLLSFFYFLVRYRLVLRTISIVQEMLSYLLHPIASPAPPINMWNPRRVGGRLFVPEQATLARLSATFAHVNFIVHASVGTYCDSIGDTYWNSNE